MEYVAGPTLEELIEHDWPLEESRVVDLMSQILSALAAAHDAGIVHRDLKPANIIVMQRLDDDENAIDVVKVCDFGVASLRDAGDISGIRSTKDRQPTVVFERPNDGSLPVAREGRPQDGRRMTIAAKNLTIAGTIVGTPAYMSPEQARGLRPDARSDLYSLGVLLFELLTHRLPFEAETSEALLSQQIGMPAPPPDTFVPCNPVLAYVALRALEKDADHRFPSARAMRAELRSILTAAEVAPTSLRPRRASSGGFGSGKISAVSALSEVTSQPPAAFETLGGGRPAPQAAHASIVAEAPPLALAPLPAAPAPTPATPPSARRVAPVAVAIAVAAALVSTGAWLRGRPQPMPSGRSSVAAEPLPSVVRTIPQIQADVSTEPEQVPRRGPDERSARVDLRAPRGTPSADVVAPGAASALATSEPAATAFLEPTAALTPAATGTTNAPANPTVLPPPIEVAKAYSADGARVRLSVATTSRTSRALVQTLVGRVNVDACYQNALRGLGRGEGGNGTATLEIDEDGVVGAVTVRLPGALAGATSCVAARFRGQRISTPPDTGSAGADIALVFEP
jgi:serine/threonine-protein kinase